MLWVILFLFVFLLMPSSVMSAHHSSALCFENLIIKPIRAYIQDFKRKCITWMGRGQHAKLGVPIKTLNYTHETV